MTYREIAVTCAVVGTGAAGYASAIRLHKRGVTDLLLISEGRERGTSRNTGSDKQTYYKLSLAGDDGDSVMSLATDLFAGGAMDGDLATNEAAGSAQSFFFLKELGVPFPTDEFGSFVGYKTDHDRGRRATSAGPYTSRYMTECLEREAERLAIPLLDGMRLVRILTEGGRVRGLLLQDLGEHAPAPYTVVWCAYAVLATGGSADLYADTVYPVSQSGALGVALLAGARAQNLTEWQFGMASLCPRWNVSGTYMQVLPRVISTDEDGDDPREFLFEEGRDPARMLSLLFMKGYQWPFDAARTEDGSSLIDLLVYRERVVRGRRVFLDYRDNPLGRPVPYGNLTEEAHRYLADGGACFGTPYERLCHLNRPAVEHYRAHGIDLATEPLEIAVCAQHANGRLSVDRHYRTYLEGLYAAGEVAGTHGVRRPGGAALNAGQVAALRLGEDISYRQAHAPLSLPTEQEKAALRLQIEPAVSFSDTCTGETPAAQLLAEAKRRMTRVGGILRSAPAIREAQAEVAEQRRRLSALVASPRTVSDLRTLYVLTEHLAVEEAHLLAMGDYLERGGTSRGSALYASAPLDLEGDLSALPVRRGEDPLRESVQEIALSEEGFVASVRPCRPLPVGDFFFETVWRAYREREGL